MRGGVLLLSFSYYKGVHDKNYPGQFCFSDDRREKECYKLSVWTGKVGCEVCREFDQKRDELIADMRERRLEETRTKLIMDESFDRSYKKKSSKKGQKGK